MEPGKSLRLQPISATPYESDLATIAGAIQLVARRRARRVTLVGLRHAERAAAEGLALAQAAGVAFALERDGASGSVAVVIRPWLE